MSTSTSTPGDKSVIHRRLVELSDSLLNTVHRTQHVIKEDLNRLKKFEFHTENRISSVSREEKHIKAFNEQTRYGTFYVWIVLLVCTVVFFMVLFLIRALG